MAGAGDSQQSRHLEEEIMEELMEIKMKAEGAEVYKSRLHEGRRRNSVTVY